MAPANLEDLWFGGWETTASIGLFRQLCWPEELLRRGCPTGEAKKSVKEKKRG